MQFPANSRRRCQRERILNCRQVLQWELHLSPCDTCYELRIRIGIIYKRNLEAHVWCTCTVNHLFLPATRIWRSGHKLESAMAVDPPTRPVPPRTRILELRIFSGSGTSGTLPVVVAGAVAFTFDGVHFKFRGNESGAIEFSFWVWSSFSFYTSLRGTFLITTALAAMLWLKHVCSILGKIHTTRHILSYLI